MSLIVTPDGMPGTRIQETLSKEEVKLVVDFEAWCRRRGIVLDLICRKCLDDGLERAARCQGNNVPNSTTYKISCGHAERVYGNVG